MKKRYKFLIGFGILIFLGLVFLHYMGFFKKIEVMKKDMPSMIVVYKNAVGSYAENAKKMSEVFEYLKEEGIETERGIGIYFDNPDLVAPEKLRASVGAILPDIYKDKIPKIIEKVNVQTLPSSPALYSEFPHKNYLSYIIGPMKVYPKFSEKLKKDMIAPSAGIEIYDTVNKKIEFYMPTGVKDLEKLFGF